MEEIHENIEHKYKEVLKLLKTNQEAIESQAVKNEYKDLLSYAMKKAKQDPDFANYIVPELIKLNLIDKWDKERYKKLLSYAMRKAEKDDDFAKYIVPELIKLNLIDKWDKERYKKLLSYAVKKSEKDYDWAKYIVPELLKLNIIDKWEIIQQYKDLLSYAMKTAKTNMDWAKYIVPELLKLNVIDKWEIKQQYKELLSQAVEKAETDHYWAFDVVPELIKLNIIEKEQYKELLNYTMEEVARGYDWARKILPSLLKLNMVEKWEIKEQYKNLLSSAIEKAEQDYDFAMHVVPTLLNLNLVEKWEIKEQYKELLNKSMEKTKNGWIYYVVPELIKLNLIDKWDKVRYKQLFSKAMGKAKTNSNWARFVIPELLKLNLIEKWDKERYKGLLSQAIEKAESNYDWARYVAPELIKLNVIEKEQYKELLGQAMEKAESNYDWTCYVVPELIKSKIIEKWDKERYKELLSQAVEKAESNYDWAHFIVPELIKLNIIEKEQYKELLSHAVEKAESNYDWACYVVPELLKLNLIDKWGKEQYKKLLKQAMETGKKDSDWARYVVPELIKLNLIDKWDKERYKELLNQAIETGKKNLAWIRYIVPELLKLNIIEKKESTVEISENITLSCLWFLEKNKDKIKIDDLKFIEKIRECFTIDETNYIYTLNYEDWERIKKAVEHRDYQIIWEIKRNYYPDEENKRAKALEDCFWKWIRTYFVDKVPGNKTIKNRFRNPHNALLHAKDIIIFAKQLEEKWVSKGYFLKDYLWVAWDRNSWYQQLNNFLEKYKKNWKEVIELEMKDEIWLKNNSEFIQYVDSLLEKEKSWELYKNLDELESILTVLNMINQKDALIKLQRLAESTDPKDKELYEYYKSAIYHPRTKPIIMDMYENPKEFLWLEDTTFEDLENIHQAKKPSNMVENFEYLDFDAHDLVSCLPLWVYDKLSYFKPFEMKFYMSVSKVYSQNEIEDNVANFIDSADQKKITNIIKKLRKNWDETLRYKIWKEDKEKFIKELITKYKITDLIELFTNLWYDEFNKYKDLRQMTAKISPKSDPNNWFNGFNCDSLAEWHGKKVVAMFNPYCTDFCIYEWDQDPKQDNLKVTSWVTLNRSIPENFTSLLWKVKSDTTHCIVEVLWDKFENYKDPSEYVITMDNIEANPNFWNKYAIAVRKMYEKFFSEYIRQNPISPNWIPINTHKFYSWVNYNKIDILHKEVPNESLPVFVNAYSDNSLSYSLQWDLDAWEQKEKEKKAWIFPLSIEDVVQISYMEWKIYPASMKDHLWNLQHEITASILNNILKWRQNLSFAWYNKEWKIWWYILAYQWKMEDWTPWVYISDFAIDEKERWSAWIKMINYWMEKVKQEYPEMPVFTEARESTSYRMIKAYAQKKWYEITKDEISHTWWENFHWVVMEPKW